jgi:type I restriction enzyme S subunit
MVKEGYKEVRIGAKKIGIPKEWKKYKFNSDYISKKMKAGGTPKSTNKDYYDGQIPFVKIEDMTSNGKYINYTENTITTKGLDDSSAWMVPKKSLLISMYGSYGKVAINNIELTTNQAILSIIPSKKVDLDYLYYYSSERLDGYFKSLVKATTQANLTKTIITNTPVVYPPLPEQKKIASILSSVDKSIEKTDEVIEETKELKKGLMQELLIKGIGHSEFKEVRIGAKTFKLPKSWDLKTVGSLFKLINGRAFKTSEWADDGLQIIRIQDLRENDNAETNYCNFEVKDKYYVYNNDLLFCWAGNIKTSLGAYIWNKDKAVLNQHIYNMKPKINLSKSYYKFLINKFLPLLKNYTGGSAGQVHITKGDFKTFDVPLPALKEQKKIASILSSVDAKIKKEEEYKAKMERLKKGLMQKLLTGEIRVNTDMEV